MLRMLQEGDHAGVIDWMPEYKKAAPEGHFGHYLMMAAAIGGARCQAPGELFSEYEASVGTGQVHVWFERPADGWTGQALARKGAAGVGGRGVQGGRQQQQSESGYERLGEARSSRSSTSSRSPSGSWGRSSAPRS